MPKAKTVEHRDYPVQHNYAGLLAALEAEHSRRTTHTLEVVNFRELDKEGRFYRIVLGRDVLAKLSPPLTDDWKIIDSSCRAIAHISRIDEDSDSLNLRFAQAPPGRRVPTPLLASQPDLLGKLRSWLKRSSDRPFPLLYQRLSALTSIPALTLKSTSPSLRGQLRAAQVQLLERLGAPRAILWGPPGTGKTYTIARAVVHLVEQGYRVALLAPTNIAVDNALVASYKAFCDDGKPPGNGQLLRAGTPALDEVEAIPELCAWQASLRDHQTALRRLNQRRKTLRDYIPQSDENDAQEFELKLALLDEEGEQLKSARNQHLWSLAEQANVLGATVFSALHRPELCAFFQHPKVALLIDEAGMVARYSILPLLELLSGGDAPQGKLSPPPQSVALVMAGDPRQFGPISRITNEKDVNARFWMAKSLLDDISWDKRSQIEQEQSQGGLTMLTEQSRMTPTICKPISRAYYHDRLTTLPDDQRKEPPLLPSWPEHGIVLLDPDNPDKAPLPDDAPPLRQLRSDKRFSERSLWVAVQLIRQGLEAGARSILWLSPFRDQVRRARKLVDSYFSNEPVHAGTVHSVQGREADLVIFDPVNPAHRWLRGLFGDDQDIHRMLNVAVSRARTQVIVLTSRNKIRRHLFNNVLSEAREL